MKLSFAQWATLSMTLFAAAGRAAPVHFGRDVLPILSENCFKCHGPDEKARKAKLRLDTREGAARVLKPGKDSVPELLRRINAGLEEGRMPPPGSNHRLTEAQKGTLSRWIAEGAVWGKHWAYETPQHTPLPVVRSAAWPRNAIDHFVLARLEQEGLAPSPQASREILIRRVTLDLTGLPPTLAEIDAFLVDTAPDAYEKVIERLLASPRFGERMASDWLDEARYADTNGFQNDFARTMWPWRDWVIAAFNRNLPYDQFVTEQLAGDLLPHATQEQRTATGFNRNNRTVTEAGSIEEEWRVENIVDRVETTATAFLGLTIGCARCHDHKYDPIAQAEFYQFFGFFNSTNEQGFYSEQRGNVGPVITLPTAKDRERLRQLDAAIADADATVRREEASKNKAALAKAKEAAAKHRQEKSDFQNKLPSVMVMEELKTPRDTYLLKRGRYDMPDRSRKLSADVPSCLPRLPVEAPHNRLGLARWMTDPSNPLTARVRVNRYWQHFFGAGLVRSTEDFGVQGQPPTHPELLDFLATEFVRTGWDAKVMQRLIVTSATYRQASKADGSLLHRDPDNRLLARGPRFRLPAEAVRDNALAIGGLLTDRIGGPSVKPYQPTGLWEELAGGAGEGPYIQDRGPNLYRRSLYIYRKRTVPHPALSTFDAPSREVCQVKRSRTDTPLQALALLNDATYAEAARRLGELMLREAGPAAPERLAYAFRRATARRPTLGELSVLVRGLEHYRAAFRDDVESAKRYLRQGESPIDERLDPVELAAHAAAAGVVLNLDETITKE